MIIFVSEDNLKTKPNAKGWFEFMNKAIGQNKDAPPLDWGISKYSLKSTLPFGKYKDTGLTVEQIIEKDISYLGWCLENVTLFELTDEAFNLFELHIESLEPEWDDYDMTWHEGYSSNFGDR